MKKQYKYFTAPKEEAEKLSEEYAREIGVKREGLIDNFMKTNGAVAWQTATSWGGSDGIGALVFELDHDITKNPAFKVSRGTFEGREVAIVRGKGNRKEGKQLNQAVTDINRQLASLPEYQAWAVEKLGLFNNQIGKSTGHGRRFPMLSTSAGRLPDGSLGARIPVQGIEDLVIPPIFSAVTYGVWYDILNENK